jgi:nucleoside-diphosphate-sugar epimerase
MRMASPSDRQPVALVTGHKGFTGRYVAQALAGNGWRVQGLALDGPDGGQIAVDLLDRERLAQAVERIRPDAVVHLAAIAFVAHGDAEALYRTNVVGTRNLLEALAGASCTPRSVVLASSANVYGNSHDDPITESTAPQPANDYAVSKLAMEYMARLWMDRLPIVVARPFNYTGVGQDANFLIPKIVSHFQSRQPSIELGNLHVWRDFSDVRMVAEAYARLVTLAPSGADVNICSGHVHSLQEVIDLMEEIAGYRIDVRVNPAFVRAGEVVRLAGSNQRLLDLVGPLSAPPLSETLRWMYEAVDA